VFPHGYRSIYELGVHEDVFEAQIRYISRTHCILCLSDFLANRYPDNGRDAAIITFDDGYLDNYLHAYPILTKYRVPATIFVVSGLVGTDGNLWNDLLVNYLEAQHEASTVRFDEMGGAFPISTFEEKRQSFYEIGYRLLTRTKSFTLLSHCLTPETLIARATTSCFAEYLLKAKMSVPLLLDPCIVVRPQR